MEGAVRAIEVTGSIDEQRRLHLDEPLPFGGSGKVRVIVLISEEASESAEVSEEGEWLRSAANNPAFGFLHDAEEDIYTLEDGRPFGDQG